MRETTKRAKHANLTAWLRRVGAGKALATLADLMDEAAVFVVDGDRQILFWSTGAERLLGFKSEDVLGQHCLKANRCNQCMQGCGISEHGAVDGATLRLFCADGETVPVRKYAQSFIDEDGAFAGGIELLVADETQTEAPAVRVPELPSNDAMTFHGMVTRSPPMRRVFEIVGNVAETEATVLVRGESGTGKELVARAVHSNSHRSKGPFMAINCAALTPNLLESELFGHVRGAFTGAIRDRAGLFQRAHGGTVFLDEVAELPLDLQASLLRVLEERELIPVGGDRSVKVDVRVIAATHRALREEVKAERFREDLMYRLRVVPIFLPALRERREDVNLLLWHFVEKHNRLGTRQVKRIAPDAMRVLLDHAWPGNVRELQNVIEYAFAVGRGAEIRIDELPPEFRETRTTSDRSPLRKQRLSPDEEAKRIHQALRQTEGDIHQAAKLLGMSRATFWRKRKALGIMET